MVCEDILDKAYKKLKSSVYYDKTNLILRDKIVDFESSHNQHLKDYLHDLWISFVLGNSAWERKKQEILSQIDVKLLTVHHRNRYIHSYPNVILNSR